MPTITADPGKGAADSDTGAALSLGFNGSDYIADTNVHIAGDPPEGGAGAGETYHPEVTRWFLVLSASDTAATFGAGSEAELGDPPQDTEPVPTAGWSGPLTKIQTDGSPVRAYRG